MEKTMSRTFVLIVLLVLGSTSMCFPGTVAAAPEIRVGWIGPLTGNAASLGVDSAPAIELIFDKINKAGGIHGAKLKLVIEDDQYNAGKTLSAYNKLVHLDGINVLIVLTYGGIFTIAERAMQDGVIIIDPLDCDAAIAKLPENIFCVAKTTEDLGYRIAELVHGAQEAPPAILYYEGDPFMGTVAETVRKKLKELGGTSEIFEGYTDATQDFRAFLTKVRSSQAKSLVFMGYDQIALAMRQARELGITLPFYAVIGTMQSRGFHAIAGAAAEGTIGPVWIAPRSTRYNEFITDFEAQYDRKPNMDLCTIPSADIAALLARAFQNGAADSKSGNIDVAHLKRQLYAIKDYTGFSGKITIDPDGITRSFRTSDAQYHEGELKILSAIGSS
jgi:branched-chain amino acid transport system substrate-binding protein